MNGRAVIKIIGVVAAINVFVTVALWFTVGGGVLRSGTRAGVGAPPAAVQHLAEVVAHAAFRSVITFDYAALNAVIKQATTWPDIVYLSVEDAEGKIVGHTDPRRLGQVWSDRVAADIRAAIKVPYREVTAAMSDSTGNTKERSVAGRVRLGYVVEPTVAPVVAPPEARRSPPALWLLVILAAVAAIPAGVIVSRLLPHTGPHRKLLPRTTADLTKKLIERTRQLAQVRHEKDKVGVEAAGLRRAVADLKGQLETLRAGSREHQREPVSANGPCARALPQGAELEPAGLDPGLVAHVARVFRTSLTKVLGFSQLMLRGADGPLSEAQVVDVKGIEAAGRHLLAFVNTLSELVRARSGTLEVRPEMVDVNAVIREIACDPELAGSTDLRVQYAGDLPEVKADRQHLREILRTLIREGASLPGQGGALLSGRADDGALVLEVAHLGRTIPDDKLRRVFEPFPPLDGLARVDADAGELQLTLAGALAAMNGGTFTVDRAPEGVRFTLRMPAMPPLATAIEDASRPDPEAARR